MKRLLAFVLCIVMAAAMFSGCAKKDEEDKGAFIPIYLSTEIFDFDPAHAYLDDAAIKVFGLIYEGLFTFNEDGKRENVLCKSYKVIEDEEDELYSVEITMNKTKWSDGRLVQAQDFVFAFKRILEPEFHSEAASLLFDIKNARDIKAADASIDDLGIYAVGETVLRIEFEEKIDYEQFLDYLASPMLVPLREDVINKVGDDWATTTQVIVNNGPYVVRTFYEGHSLVLERNIYYYRNIEKDVVDKYVLPYRLLINFAMTEEENLELYKNGLIVFDSELPLSARSEYADDVKISDSLSQHAYVFNTTNPLFTDARVRRALSMALDRQAIADKVVYAKASGGLITDGVFETTAKKKTEFREVGGELIAATADVNGAKSLLSQAGVSSGSFTLTIRDNAIDTAIAEYAKSVWEGLGFSVSIKKLDYTPYTNEILEYDLLNEDYNEAYTTGNFDVIGIDFTMSTTDAFPSLARFAKPFSGGKMDLANQDFNIKPHISGYDSEAYNTLLESAFAEKDRAARAVILHEAETLLLEDMPIIPLVTYQYAYLQSKDLGNIVQKYYGLSTFTRARLKNYNEFPETTPLETRPIRD